jgi:hypothetical protein
MSNVPRFACDRCGREIAPGLRSLVHVLEGPSRDHHAAADLCETCAADLAGWLSGGTTAPAAGPGTRRAAHDPVTVPAGPIHPSPTRMI